MSEAAKPEMMQHPQGNFCWVELGTTDAAAAKKFYSSVFGWDYEDTSMGPDQIYTMINLGGKTVGALYKIGPEQQGMPPNWQPYISVNSADETAAKARELGANIMVEPFDVADHGRMAVFADPTGATIAIWQAKEHHGAQLVNAPGAMCWNELQTRDPKAATQFYSALLGWGAKESPEYTEWVNQGTHIGGMMGMKDHMTGIPPHWMPYFAVEDCDKTVATVKANGGAAHVEPTDIPGTGRFAVLADPQGAAFSVIQLSLQT